MVVKNRKRSIFRRKPPLSSKARSSSAAGYQQGRIDGYAKGWGDGLQAGFEQGSKAESPGIVATAALKNALVIASGYIASLNIGIIQPFEELSNRGGFAYKVKLEEEVTREDIAAADVVVFLRNVEPAAYRYLEWAHEMGKRTVYVIDDNFLDIPATTPIGVYYQDESRRETFRKFLKHSQMIKVDATYFADYIRTHFNPNVIYFPASVNFALLDQASAPQKDSAAIVIGYAGGYKEETFAPVVPALQRILDYYGGFVRLEFFGFAPAGIPESSNVSFLPMETDYKQFLLKLYQRGWDIGLAPLADTPFNNSKTNNKFRDYSACGIAGIYSALPLYTEWIKHGETGYLLPLHTEDSWFAGIKQLIENPAMRATIKSKAAELSREHFRVDSCADRWNELIFYT
ncbi:glycosyltransferase family 1 protein [Paenibacillus gansuensis]|uniref:Glycosyltransferase family 1 protein n=1 Tax=Paenibacillus gansuensis TaxID=306542 RepID=A0ABW5PBW5_9BACL